MYFFSFRNIINYYYIFASERDKLSISIFVYIISIIAALDSIHTYTFPPNKLYLEMRQRRLINVTFFFTTEKNPRLSFILSAASSSRACGIVSNELIKLHTSYAVNMRPPLTLFEVSTTRRDDDSDFGHCAMYEFQIN